MEKGDTLNHDGKKFKVQKIASDSIYASLILDGGKCQRGKPRRLFFTELAASLGITVDAYVSKLKSGSLNKKDLMKEQLAQSVDLTPVDTSSSVPSPDEVKVGVPNSEGKSHLHDVLEKFDS